MNLANCPVCKKVFVKSDGFICPDCVKRESQEFEDVRGYIKEHENCSMYEVSEATGVSVKKITKYLREGKIEAGAGMEDAIRCEQCGVPIPRGKYCMKCMAEISGRLQGALTKKEAEVIPIGGKKTGIPLKTRK